MAPPKDIVGSKGGSKARTPIEAPDSLYSTATARVLDLLSEGDLEMWVSDDPLKDIFLDGTPVMNEDGTLNFSSVQVDWRPGTPNQSYIKGFPSVKSETAISYELKQGTPWVRAINNTELSAVSVRLATPQLTSTNQENGDTNGARVEYAIDLQTDGGAYENVLTSAFDGKTKSLYERGHRIDLPPATSGWQIRIRRLTPDSDTQYRQDKMFVQSITEIIDAKLRYPYSAVVGLAFDAQQFRSIPTRAYRVKGRVVRIPTNYNPITRQYSGAWDGTFKLGWTNNPAWIWYDLATNQRYGLGRRVDESRIDRWSLYKIATYCDELVPDGKGGMEPRFTCTVYLQTAADAYKVMQDLASVFRGISYWAGGSIIALADQPEDPVYTYNNANVVDGRFIYNGSGRKARHTMALVSWSNPENMGKGEVEPVVDEMGVIRYGIQTKRITAFGASSRSQAQRVGRWVLASERLETDAAQWSVGLDGTLVAPGKVVRVFDENRAGRRLGGRISTVGSTHIIVDKLPDPLPQPGDKIFTITPSGEAQESTVSSVVESTRRVNVSTAFPERPVPQSVWGIETAEIKAQLFRVLGVTDNGDGTFGMSGIQHEPGKFAEVELGVFTEPRPTRVLPGDTAPAPTNLVLSYDERAGHVLASTIINADWDDMPGVSHYFIQWKKDENEWGPEIKCTGSNADYENAFPGVYYARVWSVTQNGSISPYTISEPLAVGDQTLVPGAVQELVDGAAQQQLVFDQLQADLASWRDQVDDILAEAEADIEELDTRSGALRADVDAEVQRALDAEAVLGARADTLRADIDSTMAQVNDILGAADHDPSLAYDAGKLVVATGKLYRAVQAVPANTPITNTAYWELMGEYASLGEAVAAHSAQLQVQATEIAAHASSLALLGAKNAGGTAFLLDLSKVLVSASESLAQRLSSIQSAFGDVNSRIDTETQVRSDALGSMALTVNALVAQGGADQFDEKKTWMFDALEGWTGSPANPTVAGGWLRPAVGASSPHVISPDNLSIDGTAFPAAKARIRKVGNPTWRGWLRWITGTDVSWNTAKQKQVPEPAWDGDGIGSVTWAELGWTGSTVRRVRLYLGVAQSATDYYEVDWFGIGRVSPSASRSQLIELQEVVNTANTATAQRLATMESRMPTGTDKLANEARVQQAESTAATATGAVATSLALLGAKNAGNTAFIIDTGTARISPTETFGQRLLSIQSTFGDHSGRMDTMTQTQATDKQALTQAINSAVSEMANKASKADLTTLGETLAAADQANARTSSLIRAELRIVNETINPSFEEDGTTGWQFNGGSAWDVYTADSFSGGRSLRVVGDPSVSIKQAINNVRIPVTKGDEFRVGVYAKRVGPAMNTAAEFSVMIRAYNSSGSFLRNYGADLRTAYRTYSWRYFEGQGVVTHDDVDSVTVVITAHNLDEGMWLFDDVLLQRVSRLATALADRVSTAEADVQRHENSITALSSWRDVTQARLPSGTEDVAAASSVSAVNNRVNQTNSNLSAESQRIDGLNARAEDIEASVTEFSSVAVSSVTGNGVINPSFEDSNGWEFTAGNVYYYESTATFTGDRCLRMDPGDGQAINTFKMPVKTGQRLRMGLVYRPVGSLPNTGAKVRIIARCYRPNGSLLSQNTVADFDAVRSYNHYPYEAVYTVPSGVGFVVMQLRTVSHTSGSVAIDDVYMEPESASMSRAMATWGFAVAAGGKVTGMKATASDTESVIDIATDAIRIGSSSGAGLSWDNGALWNKRGSYSMIAAPNLGEGMMFYIGQTPSSPANARKADAIFYVDQDGVGYFAGQVLQGIIRAFNSSTTVNTGSDQSVLTPYISSNGKPVALTSKIKYTYQQMYMGTNSVITLGSGSTSVRMRIRRQYEGSSVWTVLTDENVQGRDIVTNEQGSPSNIFQQIQSEVYGTDNDVDTRRRRYQIYISALTRRSHTVTNSGTVPAANINQYLSIESLE